MAKKKLKETVEKAEKEVEELLKEVQASKPDKIKLKTGLTEVQNDLDVLSIHIGRITDGDDDGDEDDTK